MQQLQIPIELAEVVQSREEATRRGAPRLVGRIGTAQMTLAVCAEEASFNEFCPSVSLSEKVKVLLEKHSV